MDYPSVYSQDIAAQCGYQYTIPGLIAQGTNVPLIVCRFYDIVCRFPILSTYSSLYSSSGQSTMTERLVNNGFGKSITYLSRMTDTFTHSALINHSETVK